MQDTTDRRVAVIIEDDLDIRYLIEQVLIQAGFETVTTGNGEDGVRAVAAHDPVVTTLDVSLPGIDGFEVARRIRRSSGTYIVMISAMGDEIDVLQGLEAGADDYLVKPFRPRELRARLGAMLRRPREVAPADVPSRAEEAGASTPLAVPGDAAPAVPDAAPAVPSVTDAPAVSAPVASPVSGPLVSGSPVSGPAVPGPPASAGSGGPAATVGGDGTRVEHNGLALDLDARLAEVDDASVELTKTEFDLIATLLESKRRVRSKADLALALRADSYVTTHFVGDADRRNVEVHMANLRRKLGDDPNAPRFVVTVRGVGYRLTGPGDAGFLG
ncbi:two-component system response regulator [Curtobacterium sp. 'Ferrero']|uniref:response regulator transcription factor n=1 Tax=Curtobacterium sp. 'Ferrero' TaxID=2033654 RepID=UPI000BD74B1C|nr:response regulator transcription factor [Curtobacterium sp. 'Ferrero']PCN47719.1 two-component system response regulator [Curtobacterium sp. 'Ferrero']